jgi:hypothetical protein
MNGKFIKIFQILFEIKHLFKLKIICNNQNFFSLIVNSRVRFFRFAGFGYPDFLVVTTRAEPGTQIYPDRTWILARVRKIRNWLKIFGFRTRIKSGLDSVRILTLLNSVFHDSDKLIIIIMMVIMIR